MSTKVTSTSEGGEVNQQDAQFIIECLRSLDQDKNVSEDTNIDFISSYKASNTEVSLGQPEQSRSGPGVYQHCVCWEQIPCHSQAVWLRKLRFDCEAPQCQHYLFARHFPYLWKRQRQRQGIQRWRKEECTKECRARGSYPERRFRGGDNHRGRCT
jgi:hypothetical protein